MTWRPWRSAWVWGMLLLAAALPWYFSGAGLDLLPFLLTLVGGWALGVAFVNLTGRMPGHRGWVLQLVVAVLASTVLALTVDGRLVQDPRIPEQVKEVLALLQMAAIPAISWVWLALLGRVTFGAKRRQAEKIVPGFTREHGGSIVRFPAVRMPITHLWVVAGVVIAVLVGALMTLLIVFDAFVLGPRMTIIVLGGLIGLPTYYAITAYYHRRTVDASIWFGSDRMRVVVGEERFEVPFAEIRMLRWRAAGHEARVEVRTAARDISLIAGLARVPKGVAAELPGLPRHVRRSLELSGLAVERPRRADGATTWVR